MPSLSLHLQLNANLCIHTLIVYFSTVHPDAGCDEEVQAAKHLGCEGWSDHI